MNKWIVSSIVGVSLVAALAYAGKLTHVEKAVDAPGTAAMDVQLKLSVGKFELMKSLLPKNVVAEYQGEYDEDRYEYSQSFEQRGKRADFVFQSESREHHNLDEHKIRDNRWEFGFSSDVDCAFDIEIGAAETELDFGDLTVSDLRLDIGAADANIDFSSPNRTTLRDLKVEAGACQLEMSNLGNSKFEFLNFDGGMGSFTLDFSGDFDFEAEATVDVGMGSVDIIIPENVGVRIEAEEHWFNSIDFPKRKFTKVRNAEDTWESDNYKTARGKLTVVLEVGMGSANIEFK
jgi:hypothetical protein